MEQSNYLAFREIMINQDFMMQEIIRTLQALQRAAHQNNLV